MHLAEAERLRLVAVAVDVQGSDVARPWVDRAEVTFPALVDDADALAGTFGFVAVPMAICIDEDGRLAAPPAPVNIADAEVAEALEAWGRGGTPGAALAGETRRAADAARLVAARAWLRLARLAVADGRREDAAAALDRAWEADPDSWLVRKQRWALRQPDRFSDAGIDTDWQAAQITKEES